MPITSTELDVQSFDAREIDAENYASITNRIHALKACQSDAITFYDLSISFSEMLLQLTAKQIDIVCNVGFSLIKLNVQKFTDVSSIYDTWPNKLINANDRDESAHVRENRSGCFRRWKAFPNARIESMRRFGVGEGIANIFESATFEKLETISNTNTPLFKLDEDMRLYSLAKQVSNPKELTLLSVLRGR